MWNWRRVYGSGHMRSISKRAVPNWKTGWKRRPRFWAKRGSRRRIAVLPSGTLINPAANSRRGSPAERVGVDQFDKGHVFEIAQQVNRSVALCQAEDVPRRNTE